jgi:hypothetical protein
MTILSYFCQYLSKSEALWALHEELFGLWPTPKPRDPPPLPTQYICSYLYRPSPPPPTQVYAMPHWQGPTSVDYLRGCVTENTENSYIGRNIYTMSDSQMAIQTFVFQTILGLPSITNKTGKKYQNTTYKCARRHRDLWKWNSWPARNTSHRCGTSACLWHTYRGCQGSKQGMDVHKTWPLKITSGQWQNRWRITQY